MEYYRLLNQFVNEKLGGVSSAKLFIQSVNFEEIKTLTEAGDWEAIGDIMCAAAMAIEKAGAGCLLIGANTMHKVADRIQASIGIPVIHIAEVTALEIQKQALPVVALLGTRYVMQMDFYKDKLSARGIDILIPDQADTDYINNAIYTEFGKGIFLPATKQQFIKIINKLIAQGAKGVISGCTEIPLLISQDDCSVPVFDTTKIHAGAAVDFALH